ncbi:MAG: very short patch repair endonuclease [Caulobacteraceae bacterium]|nr:very short patch repair endonuclease [Caulobacteraceae bacterium]
MARTTTEQVNPARSAQMSKVRGRDTKPEMRARRALHAAGLRFRLQARDLPGRPDIVFRSRRIAIFVHGCFWHRHGDPNCKLARLPKTRLDFWEPKLEGNRQRDERNIAAITAAGWRPIVVWECQTRDEAVLNNLVATVKNSPPARGAPSTNFSPPGT